MPKFKIVIEDSRNSICAKTFEAESLEAAKRLAEAEDYRDDSWEEIDSSSNCEIRDELCEEVTDEKDAGDELLPSADH